MEDKLKDFFLIDLFQIIPPIFFIDEKMIFIKITQ
jgi:hypothetical protein